MERVSGDGALPGEKKKKTQTTPRNHTQIENKELKPFSKKNPKIKPDAYQNILDRKPNKKSTSTSRLEKRDRPEKRLFRCKLVTSNELHRVDFAGLSRVRY